MNQKLVLIFLILGIIAAPALAYFGPVAYQTEQVFADYDSDGTVDAGQTYTQCPDNTNPCRFGFMEVGLPNRNDTLQTVRVNLSATTGTNLNTKEIYKGTASSPTAIWSRSKLYVNDSVFGAGQNYYKITDTDKAPVIQFNITSYSNQRGGRDLYDYDNIGPGTTTNNMTIVVTAKNPSTSLALDDVIIEIIFDKNTNGAADAVHLTYSSLGTRYDTDSDTYYDKLNWTGTIGTGATQTFTIHARIIETTNIANGITSLNPDGTDTTDKGAKGHYAQTSSLTGLTIAYKYSRGPIRQGIDLAERSGGGAWDIRGFIRVLAKNSTEVTGYPLTYNISSWGIYNVTTTGSIGTLFQSGTYSSQNFTADYGTLYTTDTTYSSNTSRYGFTGASKPYIASSFNWYVFWNDTNPNNYASFVNTTLDLPTLYKLDIVPSKTMGGYLAVEATTEFNVTDISEYQGNDNAPAGKITILSIVPRNTTDGTQRTAFVINGTTYKVYYYNTTHWRDITGNTSVTVTVTQPGANTNGKVNLTIASLAATAAGANLTNGRKIKLTYEINAPSNLQMGDSFNFTGNTTMTSNSGTPMTEAPTTQVMSTSGRQLIGYKDLWVANPAAPTIVNASLVVQVVGDAITGIKFVDYVPRGTDFTCSRAFVTYCNSSNGVAWSCGVSSDYNVTDRGTKTLSDGTVVTACEFTNGAKTGWTLSDNAAVKIIYKINITQSGLYELPMEIAGFDPALGESVSSTVYGVVRIIVPEPLIDPVIRQTDFLTARTITVGNPVVWVKDFEVYNPNSRFTDSEFEIEVFEDTTDGFVSYLNELGERVDETVVFKKEGGKQKMVWNTKLAPTETRTYEIRILTPPVLETDRDIEVVQKLEEKMIELKMSIFLLSLAKETYENVAVNLPISLENLLSVRDGFGNGLSYNGGDDSSTIYIDKFGPQDRKEVIVNYKQSYPKIIITPDKERYDLDSTVNLDILVLHGGEPIDYPYLETEIYTPNHDLVYSNIQELGRLEPIDKTSISESFKVPLGVPGGTYIAESRLRSDLATLATGTGNFYIVGGSGYGNLLGYLLLIFMAAILYLSAKRLYNIKNQTK